MLWANGTVEGVAQRRRWRWPKALALVLAAWVLLLGIVRLGWGWHAERRFNAALAASREAGLLLELEDLGPAGIPDAENGAYWLSAAMRLMAQVGAAAWGSAPSADSVYVDMGELAAAARRGLTLAEHEHEYFRERAGVYTYLRAARGCKLREWPVRLASPLANTTLPQLTGLHEAAKFLLFGAAASFAAGDHAAALEQIRDGLALAEHMRDRRLFIIGSYAANQAERLALAGIEMNAGDIQLRGTADAEGGGPATRAQVEALIALLLDESSLDAAWREMVRIEALEMRDGLRSIACGGTSLMVVGVGFIPRWMNPLLAPALTLRAARLQGAFDALAAARQDRDIAARALDDVTEYDDSLTGVLLGAPAVAFRDWTRAVLLDNRMRCRRRMAACALAIRLYELDMGTRPAHLGELAPHYLHAVPTDLLDPRRAPFRYVPDADPPRLYSVGDDGFDDGGSSRPRRGERRPRDEVFVLDSRSLGRSREPRLLANLPKELAELLPPADLTPADAVASLMKNASNRRVEVEPPGGEDKE